MSVDRRALLRGLAVAPLAGLVGTATAAAEPTIGSKAPYGLPISADFPFEKAFLKALGSEMAYVDAGVGPPVVFLHGNPTSSYLWRNVIPHVTDAGYRAIAPDLIGMGDSAKPDIGYTFADHARHLDAFLEALDLSDVTLVIHDRGSALGMRWARLNPKRVTRLAFMEAICPPGLPAPSYEAMGPEAGELFRALRTPGRGEEMVLEGNYFVEEVLPRLGVVRPMSETEMDAYHAPFPTPGSRLPTLEWPRQIPIEGEPADVADEIVANGEWLVGSGVPKLLFHAEPGSLMPAPVVAWMVANVPELETRFLGPGLHFLQEEHPELIGRGIAEWLRRT